MSNKLTAMSMASTAGLEPGATLTLPPRVSHWQAEGWPAWLRLGNATAAETAVRLPLQRQILLPLLAIVALSVLGVSGAQVWLTHRLLRGAVDQQMQSVARTLNASTFPLETNVLRQVSGLSGAQFALLDEATGATLAVSDDAFRDVKISRPPSDAEQTAETVTLNATAKVAGESYFYAVAQLDRRASGGARRQLQIFYPERTFREARWQAIYPSLLVGGAALVLAGGLASVVAARVTQPVEQLKRQTERIAAGDFAPVAPHERDDELRDLALAVNRMATLLQANAEELRQHERAATLHQMGAGIAHQLRNAATGCRMAIDLFRRQDPARLQDENLVVAARQLELMENYLQRFLTLGRTAQLTREEADIREVLSSAASLVRHRAEHLHVAFDVAHSSDLQLSCDRTSLEQAVVNLLTNAIEACAVPGVEQPRVCLEAGATGESMRITIADNGPGVVERVRERIGEPFVTTKPEGTGLGIAVAKEIIAQHGGMLAWQRADGWTRFEIRLPRKESGTRDLPSG